MTVAKQYPLLPVQKEPSWLWVVILSGFMSGMLLFTVGWYVSLSEVDRTALFNKIMSAGDIFPGITGLNRSRILLVMGVDMPPREASSAYEAVRTDTMMLVRLDPGKKKINIVSIPRDSKVYLARGHGVNKINAAFTLGGPEFAVATVEETLGVDIDNYLVLNVHGVRDIVDALGGIDIYIEKQMHYRDRTAGLNINLKPGKQHLNGKQAEGFLRFRHDPMGDIGRIRRQQQFVAAMTDKLEDPAILLKLKSILEAGNKFIMTDMPNQDLVRIALFGRTLKQSDFEVATLPGHPSLYSYASYWIIDPKPAEDVLNRLITGSDNYVNDKSVTETPTIGILYTKAHNPEIENYASELESKGFQVICKLSLRQSVTKLVTHNSQQPRNLERKLQLTNPLLTDAQLIFSPHGATFETNSCGNSDYTIILGDDTRSAKNL